MFNVEVRGLHVGSARLDLPFERVTHGPVAVSVLRIDGPLQVVVEPALPPG